MFAVGHLSLAYLLGKASSKLLKVNPNIPTLLALSILPDIDLAIGSLLGISIHHGPTHSLIFALLIFAPLSIFYGKRVVPYFLAYVSHFLIGDFFIGGQLQLFWPISSNTFGFHDIGFMYIGLTDNLNLVAELSMLALTLIVMAKTGDYKIFFKNDKTNLLLLIPIGTLLLSTFTNYPFTLPLFLAFPIMGIPQLFLLTLFSIPILIFLYTAIKKVFT
ncbi:MAG: metal-dependent hydrolase [Nitrososphaerota archaeon]|jgi:hypothetical protein|nr:metal-dependent hydrolase [Nitrososphaerota archaeon]